MSVRIEGLCKGAAVVNKSAHGGSRSRLPLLNLHMHQSLLCSTRIQMNKGDYETQRCSESRESHNSSVAARSSLRTKTRGQSSKIWEHEESVWTTGQFPPDWLMPVQKRCTCGLIPINQPLGCRVSHLVAEDTSALQWTNNGMAMLRDSDDDHFVSLSWHFGSTVGRNRVKTWSNNICLDVI